MKKRIISMLLTVLMVMSLFSGLPLSAYAATTAGANTIEYTMAAGDYVLRICQKFGLNYYTCKDAIMILNNIYDGQWNKLAVGRTLTLPASDNDAILIANGAKLTNVNSGANATTLSTGTAATYTTGTATTGTSVATTTNFKSADSLAYYLVPYTMSAGENVSGVCNSLGVNFNIFSPFIKQVNGISDWTKVRAGQTLIIPTPVCPSVGTTCYGVMQHKVGGSDTAYGIASSNGVNYNANKTLLEVLNQTNNLANLTAGQWFYYPVPLTVSVPGTGNPGSTATTTTTTTTTDGNGTTTTTSTTTSKLYKLTSGMSASDGTMLFYVNSQAVTAAPAGAKVTIVTDTTSGKAIQSLTVKHSDGKADLHLTGDTFIMPGCDVRVDSTIKDGHDININANYSGKAVASVNNVTVQAAVKGAAVVIKSGDPNYEIANVYAYYAKTLAASTKTALTVSSSNAFIMPDANVEVEVVLRPVSTYAFYVNDPVRGSFYLQVNGSSATRAAKGATVTVVTKANEGYEPIALEVFKHGSTTERVNVFSNTFTMPGYDVDVTVRFGAKGNNILMMPSQIGLVYAFDNNTETDPEKAITDGDTNTDVFLRAYNDDDPPALLGAGYKIDYDIIRNTDGLKVSVSKKGENLYSFKMPKGGVTVTPIITATTPASVMGEIYLNDDSTAITEYHDCSFSVTYKDGNKEKRTEFKGKGDNPVNIPVLEYVDLRYTTSSGVAFVRYEVEVDGDFSKSELTKDQWSELLTNQANNGAYFQIPDGTTNVLVKAYFENGKVPMGPAVITGIGSASYKVWDGTAWKSANACNPGDTVMIVVTPGNGYKFDDSKVDSRLIVSRKDNGARIKLTSAGITLDPNVFAYTFTMPAEGVDVQAIFDPKPFVITMKCMDESGNDLTGQGLWQIAIDWVPGVADNATELIPWVGFETKFDVAYGEYVTVAMTEAGWSKYDMVSFRIDGLEYTADQLNYFYNFQMIDDRAKDLTITAVLRPKNVGVHTMTAVYDTTKLGVEFLIIDSPTGYSDEYRYNNSGALNYLNKAITGDKIGIVANSIDSKYSVKEKDISITAFGTDADRVIPTEEWIYPNGAPAIPGAPNAFRVFTFTMPDADVYVQINVSGTQHSLSIGVYDAKDNSAVNGMVRLFATTATGATISRDVGANNSFDDVPYKSVVQVLRSELALAEGKIIKDVEIKTLSGRSINYTDMTTAGEGIYFTMPDEAVWVVIRIDDQHYNIPTVVVDTQVKNGKLVYRKGPNLTDPVCSLSDFKVGEVVYVFDEPNDGYAHLGLGDLKIYVNGMNNAVNVQRITTTPHVWSFTMPEGTIILKAEFQKEEKKTVTLNFQVYNDDGSVFNDGEIEVYINGSTTKIKGTGTINALVDQTVTISSAMNGYVVSRILSESGEGGLGAGNVYTVPDDLTGDTDKLNVALKSDSNPIVKKGITGGDLNFSVDGTTLVTDYEIGKNLYIQAIPEDGHIVPAADDIIVVNINGKRLNVASFAPGVYVVADTELTEGGGIGVTTTFPTNATPKITFNIEPTDAYVQLSIGDQSTIIQGPSMIYEIASGTKIKIDSATEGYDKININATAGTISGQYYTVADDATVTIALSSSKNPITKGTYTNGNLQFADAKDMKNLFSGSADTGVEVFINDVPNAGYSALEKQDLKITKISDGSVVDLTDLTPDSANPARWSFTMPAGGVKVNATFKATAISVTIAVLDADTLAPATDPILISVAGSAATPLTSGQSVTATAGQTITFGVPSGANYKLVDSTSYKVGAETTQNTAAMIKYNP
ncbi:MAG: hypothetical protein II885_04490 [Oscillospiraceae bacterium]|nr:hypothetical protein [Oscillospiraceae bacterium]